MKTRGGADTLTVFAVMPGISRALARADHLDAYRRLRDLGTTLGRDAIDANTFAIGALLALAPELAERVMR